MRVLMHHVMRGNTDLGLDGNIIIHFVRGRCSLDCRDEEVGDLLTQFEDASGDVERLGRTSTPTPTPFLVCSTCSGAVQPVPRPGGNALFPLDGPR